MDIQLIDRMANETTTVLYATFTAQKRHLHRETYPADASRGLDIPPGEPLPHFVPLC